MTENAPNYLLLDDASLLRDCEVDKYRASGPGGQKRNKTDSAVRIRHLPTGIAAIANEDRSQHVNKRRALRRLRLMIALEVRTRVDPESYAPSETIRAYITGGGTLRIAETNESYPIVVSEVMDVLIACQLRISDTASIFGLSTAQLSDFFLRDPTVLREVNQQRQRSNLKTLR
jgi:RF-1 domain